MSGEIKEHEAPLNTQYHPAAVRALIDLKAKLQAVIADVDAAIVSNPPPAPVVPISTTVVHGTVKSDTINVYATPHANAKVVGMLAQGAVLPLLPDASRDDNYTWYKIIDGQFNDRYVQGVYLNMQ